MIIYTSTSLQAGAPDHTRQQRPPSDAGRMQRRSAAVPHHLRFFTILINWLRENMENLKGARLEPHTESRLSTDQVPKISRLGLSLIPSKACLAFSAACFFFSGGTWFRDKAQGRAYNLAPVVNACKCWGFTWIYLAILWNVMHFVGHESQRD